MEKTALNYMKRTDLTGFRKSGLKLDKREECCFIIERINNLNGPLRPDVTINDN